MRAAQLSITTFSLAAGFALLAVSAGAATAQGLALKEFPWPKDDIFCSLSRAEAAPAKDEAGRYVFVTALLDDPQVAIERGYAQLGGAPEQLDFVDLERVEDREVRRYRSQERPTTEITVEVTAAKEGKQTIFTGKVTARRQGEEFAVAVKGDCR